jgi:hypothetical protein
MALTDVYVQTPSQFGEFFKQIRQGQAPRQFSIQHLKDLGFTSTNHRAFIPLLKALGFLTADGQPTPRYHDYRNEALSKSVLGKALKDVYADLFVLRSNPKDSDRPLLEGKFKSAHNVSDRVAKLMAGTFYALLPLADLSSGAPEMDKKPAVEKKEPEIKDKVEEPKRRNEEHAPDETKRRATSLHYNIQIHLPATKDIEVFNAIFKSLKEHLLD